MTHIGQKWNKPETYKPEDAIWANANNAMIVDKGGYYEVEAIPEPTQEELNQERINELQAYLTSTDWYAVRMAETGVAIPEDVASQRASARDEISTLRVDVEELI